MCGGRFRASRSGSAAFCDIDAFCSSGTPGACRDTLAIGTWSIAIAAFRRPCGLGRLRRHRAMFHVEHGVGRTASAASAASGSVPVTKHLGAAGGQHLPGPAAGGGDPVPTPGRPAAGPASGRDARPGWAPAPATAPTRPASPGRATGHRGPAGPGAPAARSARCGPSVVWPCARSRSRDSSSASASASSCRFQPGCKRQAGGPSRRQDIREQCIQHEAAGGPRRRPLQGDRLAGLRRAHAPTHPAGCRRRACRSRALRCLSARAWRRQSDRKSPPHRYVPRGTNPSRG